MIENSAAAKAAKLTT